jgi:hypothetical protein
MEGRIVTREYLGPRIVSTKAAVLIEVLGPLQGLGSGGREGEAQFFRADAMTLDSMMREPCSKQGGD